MTTYENPLQAGLWVYENNKTCIYFPADYSELYWVGIKLSASGLPEFRGNVSSNGFDMVRFTFPAEIQQAVSKVTNRDSITILNATAISGGITGIANRVKQKHGIQGLLVEKDGEQRTTASL